MKRHVGIAAICLTSLTACGDEFRTEAVRAEVEEAGADAWTVPYEDVVDAVRSNCTSDDGVLKIVRSQLEIDENDQMLGLLQVGCPWRFED